MRCSCARARARSTFVFYSLKSESEQRLHACGALANEHLEGDAHQPSVGEELLPGVQLEHGLLESMTGHRWNAGDEPRFVVEAVPASIRGLVPAQEVKLDVHRAEVDKVKTSKHTCTFSKRCCNLARDHERLGYSRLWRSSPSPRPRSPCFCRP